VKLNLGCGRNPIDGYVNLDIHPGPGVDVVFDLNRCGLDRLPFPDDTFDEIIGIDLIEHIPNVLQMMAELYRVAKPGSRCGFSLPYGSSDDAWEDPTHVRPYFINSWAFFAQPTYFRADYGYRADWKLSRLVLEVDGTPDDDETVLAAVMTLRNVVKRQLVEMVAVKPPRPCDRDLMEMAPIELRRR
jgi:SAM-dependent methyltransferase